MKIKKCILCQNKKFTHVQTVVRKPFKFSIYSCKRCGLYFQNPLPTKKALKKIYEGIYHKKYNCICAELAFEEKDVNQEVKRIEAMEKFVKGGKLLDVGASTGFFLSEVMQRKNWRGYGVEYSKVATEKAKKEHSLSLVTGEVTSKKLQNNFFDVVTMHSVFEHLSDPNNQLREVRKKLKKDGLFIFTVPNIRSFEYFIFTTLKKPFPGFIFEHLFYYTPKTITRMLAKNGFEIIHITSRHYSSLRFPPLRPLIGILTFIPKLFLEYTNSGGRLKLGNILYVYAKKVI